jgi:hypothetical protein
MHKLRVQDRLPTAALRQALFGQLGTLWTLWRGGHPVAGEAQYLCITYTGHADRAPGSWKPTGIESRVATAVSVQHTERRDISVLD